MNKALMISIQPQHAVNILNGKKTLELRTWIPKGYVGWVYAYVTKGVGKSKYHHLYNLTEYNNGKILFKITHHNKHSLVPDGFLNSKVAFRFWFDEYEEITLDDNLEICTNERTHEILLIQSCVDYNHLNNYFMNENGDTFGYAWHIKKLEVFDEPKQLSEFYTQKHFEINNFTTKNVEGFDDWLRLKKAPQKFCYCYVADKE